MEPDLVSRVRAGDVAALARAITLVENDPDAAADLLGRLARDARGGRSGGVGREGATGEGAPDVRAPARRIGLTGPPGAGKSTLLAALASLWRARGDRVGILAVDPTSPFTGGALLGDRIRMGALAGDPGVFIRSFATRGALGGLSRAVNDAGDVLEAAGYDPIVIETVGVGQSEVEIASAADAVVVVLAPGAGDGVQAMKGGLLEAADVLVVNQADRDGAEGLASELEVAVELRRGGMKPQVLRTTATSGDGVTALLAALDALASASSPRDALGARRLERARIRVRDDVDRRRAAAFWDRARTARLDEAARGVVDGRTTAAEAASTLLRATDDASSRPASPSPSSPPPPRPSPSAPPPVPPRAPRRDPPS